MQTTGIGEAEALRDVDGTTYAGWLREVIQEVEEDQQSRHEDRRMRVLDWQWELYGYD